jgi:hypothetical protein
MRLPTTNSVAEEDGSFQLFSKKRRADECPATLETGDGDVDLA